MNSQGSEALKRARGEVVTLSTLRYKHIVGYNSAWIEQELGSTLLEELSSLPSSTDSKIGEFFRLPCFILFILFFFSERFSG